jgi:hypothetical protein
MTRWPLKYSTGDILEIGVENPPDNKVHVLILEFYGQSSTFDEYTGINLEHGFVGNMRFYHRDDIVVRKVA